MVDFLCQRLQSEQYRVTLHKQGVTDTVRLIPVQSLFRVSVTDQPAYQGWDRTCPTAALLQCVSQDEQIEEDRESNSMRGPPLQSESDYRVLQRPIC